MRVPRLQTTFLILLACASALAQTTRSGSGLYLLTATPTSFWMGGCYPAALYRVDSNLKLKLVRQIVRPVSPFESQEQGGVAAVVDDMESRIYLVYPAFRPSIVSVIHKDHPAKDDGRAFEPLHISLFAIGTSAGEFGTSSLLLPAVKVGYRGREDNVWHLIVVPGDMPTQGEGLTQIRFSEEISSPCLYPCPAKPASAAQPEWRKYQSFRFEGSPGGPTAPGLVPVGKTTQNYLVTPGPEGTWIPLDSTPPGFPAEKSPPHNSTIIVVAASERYFAFMLTQEGYRSLGLTPTGATVYVHDRRLNTWKETASAATVPYGRRIFGSWLATIVEVYTPGGESPENPGRGNERCCEPDDPRAYINVPMLRPYVRNLYPQVAAKGISIPGTLVLDNLEDGRRIIINAGQEDSEILTVRDDGLVLYRVNDSIFEAHIEGSNLTKPTLVAKDEDVPEVHWVFWSPSPGNANN